MQINDDERIFIKAKTIMKNIQHIVIVGGGTAGWIAANILCKELSHNDLSITLIESPDIPTIGVGEATIPPFIDMLDYLDIDHQDFINKTQATYKLGIEFRNWHSTEHRYFHPFGKTGNEINGVPFYDAWRFGRSLGLGDEYLEYSPTTCLARQHRFAIGKQHPNSPLSLSSYALHIDARLTAEYLKHHATRNGVRHITAEVNHAEVDNGIMKRLHLNNHSCIEADFFIDCTGFNALLIGQYMKTQYTDWSQYLPVDRAVTVQSELSKQHQISIPPYTRAQAHNSGWSWHIPLQQRIGNGYVFSTEYCSDEQALETLKSTLDSPMLHEPRFLNFKTGYRHESWKGNCLALGLAGGFLEPLESTAIHMVTKGLQAFLKRFPQDKYTPFSADAFNSEMCAAYTEIRDFLVLHYCISQRKDTPFWQRVTTQGIPETLSHKIGLYTETGNIEYTEDALFTPESWWAIYHGLELFPNSLHRNCHDIDVAALKQYLHKVPLVINEAVKNTPPHKNWFN